jgi:hypothetical protein
MQEFVKSFEALRVESAQQSWAIAAKKDWTYAASGFVTDETGRIYFFFIPS